MNVLKPHLRITIETLLGSGTSAPRDRTAHGGRSQDHPPLQRALDAKSPGVATGSDVVADQTPPPRPPAIDGAPTPPATAPVAPTVSTVTPSACEPHRAWIEAQVAARAQCDEHLPRARGRARLWASVQLGEALRREAARRARRSGSTCWSFCPARKRRSTTGRVR